MERREQKKISREKGETPSEKFLREMKSIMRKRLVVDIFTLVGLVLKERVGSVRLHDKAFDRMFRMKHLQITFLSLCAIPITFLMSNLMTTSSIIDDSRVPLTMEEAFENTNTKITLIIAQIGMTFTSLVTCFLIVQKYQLVLYEKRRQWSGLSTYDLIHHNNDQMKNKFEESYSFWLSGIRWRMLLELAIHICHPFININTSPVETLFGVLQAIVFVRMYLVVRLIFLFSEAFQARFDVVASNQDLQRTGFQVRARSTLVIVYYRYPVLFTALMTSAILLPFGFLVYLAEREEQPDPIRGFGRPESGYWFTFTTFTTVGYGDVVPKTVLGRLCAIIVSAIGVTIRILFGGVVTNLMVQSKEQRHVSEYLRIVRNSKECRHAAARTIQAIWRYYRKQSGDVVSFGKWEKAGHKSNTVYKAICEFKAYRWRLSQSQSTANDPVVDAMLNNVASGLTKMASEQHPQGVVVQHEENMINAFAAIDHFIEEVDSLLDSK